MRQQVWGGDIIRMGHGELVQGAALPGARLPAEVAEELLASTGREAVRLELATRDGARWQDDDLTAALDGMAWAGRMVVRTRLRLACEVARRGLHRHTGFGLVDWLAARCPDLDGPAVRDLAKVAVAGTDPAHEPVVRAVLEAGMPLARAARLLRTLQRLRGGLDAEVYAALVEALTGFAADPGVDEPTIARKLQELLRRCLPEKDLDERNKRRRGLRDVHESSLADGTVRRLVITFGDDGDYEAVRAILRSPLAAPASQEEQDATGVAETSTPGQRRYDALMTVIRRGVAGSEGQPTTAKALLMVTMDLEVLRRLLSEKADEPGCGSTLDGASVTADTIRRLACDAETIPAVLGTKRQVVDLGLSKRLVTPGQRPLLARRDGCCTIPGCTVPATWCDAHHVVWWSRGGRSDLDNYALLCPRHHTWVHDHDLTATVTSSGVTWHLR